MTPTLEAQGAGHYATLYAEMNATLAAGGLGFHPDLPLVRGATSVEATLDALLAP